MQAVENQLEIIVKDSGLEATKAQYILKNFQNYFDVAADWEKKAKTIIVTSENQKADMDIARVGRLFLREKRIAIEKARKELKEQSLREGKAIDGIANVLKALIVPIEDYLEQQEKFPEIQAKKKEEAMRLEIERRIEEERIAKEKAEAEERERIKLENERLKKEAEEREKAIIAERKKQEEKLAEERAKADAERKKQEALLAKERANAEAERREAEEKARKEKEAQEKKLAEERAKAEAERKKTEAKLKAERETARIKQEAERREKERLEELLSNQVECPFCHKKFQLERGQR
jgi:hypothetical protein